MNNNKIKEIGIIIMNMALKELQNWVNMKDGKKLKKLKWKTPKNLQVMEEKQPLGKDHMNNIKKIIIIIIIIYIIIFIKYFLTINLFIIIKGKSKVKKHFFLLLFHLINEKVNKKILIIH